jgi:hypothetical protein
MTADLRNLVVEILHNRGDDDHPDWSVGSGFFVGTRLVLTALHNVDGQGELLVRVHGKEEHPAIVSLQGDKDMDLAVLEVSDVAVDVPPLRYGAVDRSTPAVVEQCWAIGFPRLKVLEHERGKPKPPPPSAHVNGEIPTGEYLGQQLLTLQVRSSPRSQPQESEWAGMSGAVVFSDDYIVVGVITEHHLSEGESALTVVPITALDQLPEVEATKWWELLGVSRQELVRLPREDGQHFDSLRRGWYEKETRRREHKFRYELSEHFDGVPSPLSNYWSHFIEAPSWHEKVKRLLNKMYEHAKEFPELASLAHSLIRIDCDANYEAILASLRKLFADHAINTVTDVIANLRRISRQLIQPNKKEIDKLRNAEQLLNDMDYLEEQSNHPDFQRCFLFIGGLGAGKTHFIVSLLATSSTQNKSFLLLDLSLSPDGSLDEQILRDINKRTGKHWSNLNEFNAFLKKEGKGTRLVISIDDIHKWLSLRGHLKDLIDVISSHTDLDAIYWLIALENTSYDKVTGKNENRFWRDYSYRPKKEDQERLFSIGGWLDLDELNRSAKIGLKLLRQQMSSKGEDDLRAFQMLNERADTMRYLSSPFIAWILWRLCKERQLPLSRVVNLNFIEFIIYYWDELSSAIDPHPLTLEQIQQFIHLFAKFLAQSDSLTPNRTWLLNSISQAAVNRNEFQDRNLAQTALAVLERGPLLEWKKADQKDPEERTEIRFEPFWEYHLACQLQCEIIQRESPEEAKLKLEESWFKASHPEDIKQGVFEFLLLLLDKSSYFEIILQLGINARQSLNTSIWLAGPKLSTEGQHTLVDLAAVNTNVHDMFAFMYFVSESSSEVLDIPERLALLQPYYRTIKNASLDDYYFSIVERLFARLGDNNNIVACMTCFLGCEVMDITQKLAKLTIETMARNTHNNMNEVLEIALEYLKVDYKKNKNNYRIPNDAKNQLRYFYRRWVLSECCFFIVDSMGLESYNLLVKHQWYMPQKQIEASTSKEMRQEANAALGSWYRTKASMEEKRGYIALINQLAENSNLQVKESAFFLIRHTEVTEGRKGVLVDEVFHSVYRKLCLDPELQKLRASYSADFQANVKDYKGLKKPIPPKITGLTPLARSRRMKQAIDYIQKEGSINYHQYRELTKVSAAVAHSDLKHFVEHKALIKMSTSKTGNTKDQKYTLSPRYPSQQY